MVVPAAGAVVLVHFPFLDLSQTKLRPAVVLAGVGRGDWILCQVTSKPYGDERAIKLEDVSFTTRGAQALRNPRVQLAGFEASLPYTIAPCAAGSYIRRWPARRCRMRKMPSILGTLFFSGETDSNNTRIENARAYGGNLRNRIVSSAWIGGASMSVRLTLISS